MDILHPIIDSSMEEPTSYKSELPSFWSLAKTVLAPERRFYVALFLYGIVTSLFTLAIPISVQALISSVTNMMMMMPIVILAMILCGVLLFSALLNSLKIYIVETMERHIYTRITRDITLRLLYCDPYALADRNPTTLANRYFEIMNIQKTLPSLLVRGFSLILQASVGLVLVSLYHPFLFALNMFTAVYVFVVWRLWCHQAKYRATKVSDAKYETARIISELTLYNPLFRSQRHTIHACERVNEASADYVMKRRKFFRSYFSQHVSFLLLYALGSSTLLGIGGMLVIRAELTIAQLVAAELIMAAIFYNITRLAYHLNDFYDLFTSCKKMTDFYTLPPHHQEGSLILPEADAIRLEMQHVHYHGQTEPIIFDFALAAGANIMARIATHQIEYCLFELIRKNTHHYKGRIALGGINLRDLDARSVEDGVIILDNHHMMECSVRHWLSLSKDDATHDEMINALHMVELDTIILNFPEGLDTIIRPSGDPLHFSEMMRLKLAAALLARPRMLIINGLFDALHSDVRERIVQRIMGLPFTFLYCSNAQFLDGFDGYMDITATTQYYYQSRAEYEAHRHSER
ncbi:MAG: ABC transporter ATP-binding protein [Alphaproteobacteria bacterium]|nr:MAG: ABC transporter ATP-binding protein [Alphaproteobacteria bacterium]TAF15846.1 MAG: ABC transporter ATP-binding protein [Alphaproteobacteria bacterium]TAF77256.1 MAG: ABC transporter ATP-binding protein [Alphaproteobacteria bacterium]